MRNVPVMTWLQRRPKRLQAKIKKASLVCSFLCLFIFINKWMRYDSKKEKFGLQNFPLQFLTSRELNHLNLTTRVVATVEPAKRYLEEMFNLKPPHTCELLSPSIFQDRSVYFRTLCGEHGKGGFSFISKSYLNPGTISEVALLGLVPPSYLSFEENGFEDCRGFSWNSASYLICSVQSGRASRRQVAVELGSKNKVLEFNVSGLELARIEKNWIPLLHGRNLYFIYSFSPFIVLKCDLVDGRNFHCNVEYAEETETVTDSTILRGGTPCIPIDNDRFLCISHGRWIHQFSSSRRRRRSRRAGETKTEFYYRGIIAVIGTEPWGVLGISSALYFPQAPCSMKATRKNVQYPTGILKEGNNLIIGAHFEDEHTKFFEFPDLLPQIENINHHVPLSYKQIESFLSDELEKILEKQNWC